MILTSANNITSKISATAHSVFAYLELAGTNRDLVERYGALESEVIDLRRQIAALNTNKTDFNALILNDSVPVDSIVKAGKSHKYNYITADVINNSTSYLNNYITINKGSKDGIKPDMGVVSPKGVIGIVTTVSNNMSVVISLLSSKLRVSCKVKDTHFFGSLKWKNNDVKYAYLEELPSHATFQAGDTVVTTGMTPAFPPSVMVGTVESYDRQKDDNFFSLKVRLSTDFQSLGSLCVISNTMADEQTALEREVRKND
jgi:rod shape-determining protein MreC